MIEDVNKTLKLMQRMGEEVGLISTKNCNEFDINSIPEEELTKQYYDFDFYCSINSFSNPLLATDEGKYLSEDRRFSYPIEKVEAWMRKSFGLASWQIMRIEGEQNLEVIMIVPSIGENERKIIKGMTHLGYYYSTRKVVRDLNGKQWAKLQFEAKYPQNDTEEIRYDNKILYHLTPRYNLDDILSKGLVPLHLNSMFEYPPRTYFLYDSASRRQIEFLGQQLCRANTDKRNNGEYVLLTIDVQKIPKKVSFYKDLNYKYGTWTYDKVPANSIKSAEIISFKK